MAIEFNTEFYLQSKFNQLEEAGRLEEFGLTDVASLAAFFEENGVDAQEHYLNAGMAEGINPSAEFDTTAYLEAKLAELKDTAKYGDTYAEYTVEDVIAAFKTANLTPLQHFNTYGESEGLTAEPAEEAGETSELTEALNTLQNAQAEQEAALKAIAEFNLPADATDAQVSSEMANLSGDTRTQLLATATQDVANAQQSVLAAEADLAIARRDIGTDAELKQDVTEAQKAVNDDTSVGGARELQMNLQNAEAEVAEHVAANGDDQAVAKTLFDAVTAYVEAGGSAATFSAFTSAYNTELLEAKADQDFSTVLDAAAGIFTVSDGSVTAPDLSGAATADLRVAVREAALVAVERDELNDAATSAEQAFTAGSGTAAAAVLTVDLTDADLSGAGSLAIAFESGSNNITFTNQADLLSQLNALNSSIDSATIANDTLTITSDGTGASESIEITSFTTVTSADTDPGSVAKVTGQDATSSLGQNLVTAQEAVATRETLIDAVAKAEGTVSEEQAELQALTELVDVYIAAGEDVEEARDALEENFGIESLVELSDGDNVGVANTGELFLFSQTEDAQSLSIAFESEDQLYIGEGFTLNSEADFSEGEGDASVLEVFFVQQGANTQVQIEQTAFGSNAATPEVDTITLTGVNADDLQFNNGYITVNSAVEVA